MLQSVTMQRFRSIPDRHILLCPEGWNFTKAVADKLLVKVLEGNEIKTILGLSGEVHDTSRVLELTTGTPHHQDTAVISPDVITLSYAPVIERLTEKQRISAINKFHDNVKEKQKQGHFNAMIPRYSTWTQIGKIQCMSFSICIQTSGGITFNDTDPGYFVSVTVHDRDHEIRAMDPKSLMSKRMNFVYCKNAVDKDPFAIAEDVVMELHRIAKWVRCGVVPDDMKPEEQPKEPEKPKKAKKDSAVVQDESMEDARDMLDSAEAVLAFSEFSSSPAAGGPCPPAAERKQAQRAARKKKM